MARRLALAGLVLLLLAAAAVAVLLAERRALAERALVSALEQRGFAAPRLRVSAWSPRRLELRDLRLGAADELRVDEVEARYSAAALRAGRLDALRVRGLTWRLGFDAGGPRLGVLEEGRAAADASDGGAAPLALPFEQAELSDARVAVETPYGALEATGGALYREGDADLELELAPFELATPGGGRHPVPTLRLVGRLRPEAGALGFEARLSQAGGPLALRGSGRHDLAAGAGEVAFALEPLRFEEGGLQPAQLVPALAAWLGDARGELEATGRARWEAGVAQGSVDVALRDWSLTLPSLRIEQLHGAVHLEGPRPLTAPPGQLLSMARLDFGLELTNGLVRFALPPDGSLEIQHAEWSFAGGRIHTAGRLDPAARRQKLRLEIQGVELAQLLARVPLNGLRGDGRLSGSLPLVFSGEAIEIRGGRLAADPGGGWIRYAPPAAVSGLGGRQRGFDVMLGAFENFRYQKLELTLHGDTQGPVKIGLHLRGSNPEYQNGRSVEFNLNLESRLVDLLRRGAEAYRVPAAVEKRLGEIATRAGRAGKLDAGGAGR